MGLSLPITILFLGVHRAAGRVAITQCNWENNLPDFNFLEEAGKRSSAHIVVSSYNIYSICLDNPFQKRDKAKEF